MLTDFADRQGITTLDVFKLAHKDFGLPNEDPEQLHAEWKHGTPPPFFVYRYVEQELRRPR